MGEVPECVDLTGDYECTQCSARGVSLWRQYNTFAEKIRLMCRNCAERDQGEARVGDSIKWMVPAIPTDGTFWGYTSVPQAGVDWWRGLPEYPEGGERG